MPPQRGWYQTYTNAYKYVTACCLPDSLQRSSHAPLLVPPPSEGDAEGRGRERAEWELVGQGMSRQRQLFSTQAVAAGSATGNKHISHIHSTPVTVQMASPGREAGRAMKKDEQSDRERNTEGRRQREGRG